MLTTFQPEKFKLLSGTFANAIRMALYNYPPVQCIYYLSIVYLVSVCVRRRICQCIAVKFETSTFSLFPVSSKSKCNHLRNIRTALKPHLFSPASPKFINLHIWHSRQVSGPWWWMSLRGENGTIQKAMSPDAKPLKTECCDCQEYAQKRFVKFPVLPLGWNGEVDTFSPNNWNTRLWIVGLYLLWKR